MKASKPKTIDEYIELALPESRSIMKKLQTLIESTTPKSQGGISWNVPIYKYNGILAGFDAAKKHVSFGIDCLNDQDRKKLDKKGYRTGKSTIQIKFGQTVPTPEIKQLLIRQAKLNEKK